MAWYRQSCNVFCCTQTGFRICYQTEIFWFVRSSVRSLVRSFVRSFVRSLIHSFNYSFIQLFIHSFIHLFKYSFIYLFIHLFMYSFTNPEFIRMAYTYPTRWNIRSSIFPLYTCHRWKNYSNVSKSSIIQASFLLFSYPPHYLPRYGTF